MDRFDGPAHLMIVSDLDHTMVDHHDPANLSLLRFNALWEANYHSNSLLVFSTGRSPMLYKELRSEKPLLTPDITIMSVGTEITYGESMVPDNGWVNVLNQKWDRSVIMSETSRFSELKLQPHTEQRHHKVSFNIEKELANDVIRRLSVCLESCGLDIKIIYSGGIDLDILPKAAGKGQALAYLLNKFKSDGRSPVNTLVCGDSGNDADLFTVSNVYGVMVSNAQDELLQWYATNAQNNPRIIHATERCSAGIIQAIEYFRLGASISPRDTINLDRQALNPEYEIVKFYLFYERWRKGEIADNEQHLHYLRRICDQKGIIVHPSGAEQSLYSCIEDLKQIYGDRRGMKYSIWIDRASTSQLGSDIWLVKFDKWEESDKGRHCCLITALLCSQGEADSFVWVHMHGTWMDGYGAKELSCFF